MKPHTILFSGLAALILLLAPAATPAKMLIGAMMTGNTDYYRVMHKAIADDIKKRFPNDDIKIVLQRPFPDPTAWSNSARKLIVGEVDLLITYGYPATNAVLAKRSDIPVVYVAVFDPASAISGGNVSGCGYTFPLESMIDAYGQARQIKRLGVIFSLSEGDSVNQMKEIAQQAEKRNISLLKLDLNVPDDIHKLSELGSGDVVFLTGSSFAHIMIDDITATLRDKNVPILDLFPNPGEGRLITMHQDPAEVGRKAAEIIARVIGGEQAQAIEPVVLNETGLVLNLKEAGKMGITFPDAVKAKAAQVIE